MLARKAAPRKADQAGGGRRNGDKKSQRARSAFSLRSSFVRSWDRRTRKDGRTAGKTMKCAREGGYKADQRTLLDRRGSSTSSYPVISLRPRTFVSLCYGSAQLQSWSPIMLSYAAFRRLLVSESSRCVPLKTCKFYAQRPEQLNLGMFGWQAEAELSFSSSVVVAV